MQQMSSGLEGHMLPGLLWEARQPVIEFNTSRFSPQLPVQGPSLKLFLVTFCLVILFRDLIRAASLQLQLCCRLYLISGRRTAGANSASVALQRPSDLSFVRATPAMAVRDRDTGRTRSRHEAPLTHGVTAGWTLTNLLLVPPL